jgi:hypothetical protein
MGTRRRAGRRRRRTPRRARADGDGDPTTVTIDSPPRETASEARTREETSIERATRRV